MMQLGAELDRMSQKTVSQGIKEGWLEMISKIIAVAEDGKENESIEGVLATAPDDISDGKFLVCLCTNNLLISFNIFWL